MRDRFLMNVAVYDEEDAIKNAIMAALQHNKTYKSNVSTVERKAFRKELVSIITKSAKTYKRPVSDSFHCSEISRIAKTLSKGFGHILQGGEFRFGTCQKALNLYLKFLWLLGKIPQPPHCPIDRIVLQAARIEGNWTKCNSANEYKRWIKGIKIVAGTLGLSKWEYSVWNQARP
jgi:hypothetical protein